MVGINQRKVIFKLVGQIVEESGGKMGHFASELVVGKIFLK